MREGLGSVAVGFSMAFHIRIEEGFKVLWLVVAGFASRTISL